MVRATGDIDFLYRRTAKNVRALCAAMQEFGAPREVIDQTSLMTSGILTQFGRAPVRIDLLNAIDGVTFLEVWNGATRAMLDGQEIRVIGLRELKKNKNATGRKRDQEDVRRLTSQKAGRSGRESPARDAVTLTGSRGTPSFLRLRPFALNRLGESGIRRFTTSLVLEAFYEIAALTNQAHLLCRSRYKPTISLLLSAGNAANAGPISIFGFQPNRTAWDDL